MNEKGWRGRTAGALIAVTAATASLFAVPVPAHADQSLDMAMCVAQGQSSGSLSVSTTHVVWGDTVNVSWTTALSSYCTAGAGWGLWVFADGLLQYSGQATHGAISLTPALPTTVSLTLSDPVGNLPLGSTSVAVDPYDPLVLPASQQPTITLVDDSTTSRRLFVQAVRTPGETVVVRSDLDLSGMDQIRVAPRVQIVGDGSVRPTGPRLHTRTFPTELLSVGGHGHGASDQVRITGVRLDGGMSDDPFTAVGQPDADGIAVYSSQNVEIDHDELDHFRGSAVNVHDPDHLISQANANTVHVHDNWIHHNQHPSADTCIDSLLGHGHAAGYGVVVTDGAYALIDRNVFDYNRHAIAGDGKDGDGYKAYDNLILTHGGVHFHCVQPDSSWIFVLPAVAQLVRVVTGILDGDLIYHTHIIDMHGSSDAGNGDHSGGLAGEWMDIAYNTVLYTAGNDIHLRGTPARASDSPPGVVVGMTVHNNVFAQQDRWAGIDDGVISPGALMQNETGLLEWNNEFGVNTFDQRGHCDFDGDGVNDDFVATGVTWWYASSRLGGRWVYLDRSSAGLGDVILRDVTGDVRCDVTAGGVVHQTPSEWQLDSINTGGSPIAATRRSDGRVEVFGTNAADAVFHAGQSIAAGPLGGWSQFDGSLRSVAAATDTDGRIEVVGVDGSGRVFLKWQTSAGGAYSAGWSEQGGLLRSVAAARNADGRLEVFGANQQGAVFHRWQNVAGGGTGWTGWNQLDGGLAQVAAETDADGRMELFGVNNAGQIWHRTQTSANSSTSWTGWSQMDGLLSSISLARNSDGRLELFGANALGNVWHRVQSSPGSWAGSTWQQFDGSLSQVAAETDTNGRIALYGVQSSGQILSRVQPAAGSWDGSSWSQVDGLLRPTRPIVPVTPMRVTPGAGPASPAGAWVSTTVTLASAGTAPYHWSASGLPAGLTMDPNSGVISGVPATPGYYGFTTTVVDSSNPQSAVTTSYTWTVQAVVPDIVGLDYWSAAEALGEVGLSFGYEHDVMDLNCTSIGIVLGQSPGAGAAVAPWSAINYDLGVAPSGDYQCN